MEINKILFLVSVILLSRFRHALTKKLRPSTSTASQRVTVQSEKYDTSDTLMHYLVGTWQQFNYVISNINKIPLFENGDPLNASFEQKNAIYSISFSDIVFSTETHNFLDFHNIISRIDDHISLTAAILPDRKCILKGRISVTDFTIDESSGLDEKNRVGHFTVTFDKPSFRCTLENHKTINDSRETFHFPSFEYNGFDIRINDLPKSHTAHALKFVSEITEKIVSSLTTKMVEKFIKFLTTDPAWQTIYSLCMNHADQTSLNDRNFASFEKSYYYLITNGTEITFENSRVTIDSVRLNGIQPTLVDFAYCRGLICFRTCTWDTGHYSPMSGYVNCRYYSGENSSGTFEKLNFKIEWFLLDASMGSGDSGISRIDVEALEEAKVVFSNDTNLPSFALESIRYEVTSLIRQFFSNAYERKQQELILQEGDDDLTRHMSWEAFSQCFFAEKLRHSSFRQP